MERKETPWRTLRILCDLSGKTPPDSNSGNIFEMGPIFIWELRPVNALKELTAKDAKGAQRVFNEDKSTYEENCNQCGNCAEDEYHD